MRKTDATTIIEMRAHAKAYPEQTYRQLAATFGISEISVKRHCADLGRGKHWKRGRKEIEDTGAARLWSAVEKLGPDDCWEWQGCINDSGYGTIHFRGKSHGAHRVAYHLTHGEIPNDVELDHLCRNRRCCNPRHLEPISHDENMRRVRVAQAKIREGLQSRSSADFETGLGIDTRQNIRVESVTDAARTIVKEYSINPNGQAPNASPVSMGEALGRFKDPFDAGPEVGATGHPQTNQVRGHTKRNAQRGLPELTTPVNEYLGVAVRYIPLCERESDVYRIRKQFWSNEIDLRILAPSEKEARLMFTSTWGEGYEEIVEKLGVTNDVEEIANWRSGWREQLGRKFKDWKAIDLGHNFETIKAKNTEKVERQRQAILLEKEENDWAWYCSQLEDHLLAEEQSKRSSPRSHHRFPTQSCRTDTAESDDDEPQNDELDY